MALRQSGSWAVIPAFYLPADPGPRLFGRRGDLSRNASVSVDRLGRPISTALRFADSAAFIGGPVTRLSALLGLLNVL